MNDSWKRLSWTHDIAEAVQDAYNSVKAADPDAPWIKYVPEWIDEINGRMRELGRCQDGKSLMRMMGAMDHSITSMKDGGDQSAKRVFWYLYVLEKAIPEGWQQDKYTLTMRIVPAIPTYRLDVAIPMRGPMGFADVSHVEFTAKNDSQAFDKVLSAYLDRDDDWSIAGLTRFHHGKEVTVLRKFNKFAGSLLH